MAENEPRPIVWTKSKMGIGGERGKEMGGIALDFPLTVILFWSSRSHALPRLRRGFLAAPWLLNRAPNPRTHAAAEIDYRGFGRKLYARMNPVLLTSRVPNEAEQ